MLTRRYTTLGIIIGFSMLALLACQAAGTPTPAAPVAEEQSTQVAPPTVAATADDWEDQWGHANDEFPESPRVVDYIKTYLQSIGVVVIDHGSWFEAHMASGTGIYWGEFGEANITMKDIDGFSNGKDFYVMMRDKFNWVDNSLVKHTQCAGTFGKYDPSVMSEWRVDYSTIIQFEGDPSEFITGFEKAWTDLRKEWKGCPQ